MTSNQHRCVFVGNIPYDASEEQLIRICEEVGPVVSFRLVLDRETGKPKGYGFCEYRDEETALSARRNLQGYEINGRQLRVDFAENEKGSADRNREQGRGGPGLAQNIDVHKQTGGPKIARDPFLHQPIGLSAAASAAAVMAGMLGGPQVSVGISGQRNGIGVGGMPIGTDALSNHLAGMSRYQLYEVISQMKNLIQQNQQQARQILTAYPQLTKALLQAQIMLGLVRAPQMMQAAPTPPQNVQGISQLPIVQQAPLQQGLHTGQLQLPLQGAQLSQVAGIAPQLNQPSQNSQFQPSTQTHLHLNTGSTAMPFPPQSVPSLPSHLGLQQRSQPQASLNVHQPPLPQLPRPLVPPSPPQPQSSQGASFQFPPTSQASFQPMGHTVSYPAINPPLPNQPPPQQVLQLPRSGADAGGGAGSAQSVQPSIAGIRGVSQDGAALSGRGSAMGALSSSAPLMTWSQPPPSSVSMINTLGSNVHLGPGIASNGTAAFQPMVSRGAPIEGAGIIHSQGGPAQSFVQSQTQPQPAQPLPQQQQQQPQVSLEPEQQKALLQQVMNLTPEQINSLPLEQRQQVLQLQQAFRNQAV